MVGAVNQDAARAELAHLGEGDLLGACEGGTPYQSALLWLKRMAIGSPARCGNQQRRCLAHGLAKPPLPSRRPLSRNLA